MKKWKVNYFVSGFITFKEPFKSNDVEFSYQNGKIVATIFVEEVEEDQALKKANEKIEWTLSGISFVTGMKCNAEIINIVETTQTTHAKVGSDFLCSQLTVTKEFTTDEKQQLEELFSYLTHADKIGIKAYTYFQRGVQIEEWNSEAFLNFFNAIEVTADQYFDKAYEENQKRIKEEKDQLLIKLKDVLNQTKYSMEFRLFPFLLRQ